MKHKACICCLRTKDQMASNCPKRRLCMVCKKYHHFNLHSRQDLNSFYNKRNPAQSGQWLDESQPQEAKIFQHTFKNGEHILLQTVVIKSPSNGRQVNIMLDGCSTHTIIHEKAIPWLKTKFVSSSVLEVENLHGEESYPVSLMEVELPRVGGNNVKIKAYAPNWKFSVVIPNKNLIQE